MSRVISADVPEKVAEQIEEYQEDDESRSSAIRRLVRAGLDAETGQNDQPALVLIWLGSLFFVAAFADTTPSIGTLGAVTMVIGILLLRESVRNRIDRLYHRFSDT